MRARSEWLSFTFSFLSVLALVHSPVARGDGDLPPNDGPDPLPTFEPIPGGDDRFEKFGSLSYRYGGGVGGGNGARVGAGVSFSQGVGFTGVWRIEGDASGDIGRAGIGRGTDSHTVGGADVSLRDWLDADGNNRVGVGVTAQMDPTGHTVLSHAFYERKLGDSLLRVGPVIGYDGDPTHGTSGTALGAEASFTYPEKNSNIQAYVLARAVADLNMGRDLKTGETGMRSDGLNGSVTGEIGTTIQLPWDTKLKVYARLTDRRVRLTEFDNSHDVGAVADSNLSEELGATVSKAF